MTEIYLTIKKIEARHANESVDKMMDQMMWNLQKKQAKQS